MTGTSYSASGRLKANIQRSTEKIIEKPGHFARFRAKEFRKAFFIVCYRMGISNNVLHLNEYFLQICVETANI